MIEHHVIDQHSTKGRRAAYRRAYAKTYKQRRAERDRISDEDIKRAQDKYAQITLKQLELKKHREFYLLQEALANAGYQVRERDP